MDYRDRITAEAAALFMKYGVRAVTMDSIAHELGMSKRTIYEHFSDKDTLLENVIRTMAEKQKVVFREIMDKSGNVIEAVFEILRVASSHFRTSSPTYLTELKKYHYGVYEKLCKKSDIRNFEMSLMMLRRGVEEKIFRDDLNIDIVNSGIHAAIDITRDNQYLPDRQFSRTDIINDLLINYLRGISTEKGRKLIDKYTNQKNFEFNG
ncbi:MAG TPA: TetR/AcrR family transcriptional regulator [Bacteroidales bacterium]|nr:TetR/AcrR family transcriptional regulator [Bacteroidales bacterium]